jgi:hypothetical protein
MVVTSNKRRAALGLGFLSLAAGATCALNVQGFFWEPLPLWIRLAIPALLITGLTGALLGSKVLRALGWVGIGCLSLLVVYLAFLTDDFIIPYWAK